MILNAKVLAVVIKFTLNLPIIKRDSTIIDIMHPNPIIADKECACIVDSEVVGRGGGGGLVDFDHRDAVAILGGDHHARFQRIGAQESAVASHMPGVVIGRFEDFGVALSVQQAQLPNRARWRTDQCRCSGSRYNQPI